MQNRVEFFKKFTLQELKDFTGSLTSQERIQIIQDVLNEGISTGDTIVDVQMPTTWLDAFMDWEVGTLNDYVVRIRRSTYSVEQDLSASNSALEEGTAYWVGRGTAFTFGGAAGTVYKVFAWYGTGGPVTGGHGELEVGPGVTPVKYYDMSGGLEFGGTGQQLPAFILDNETSSPYAYLGYGPIDSVVRGTDILVTAVSSIYNVASYDKSTSTWTPWSSSTGIANHRAHLGINTGYFVRVASDSTYTVFAGKNRVASFDGSDWKNFDGSGAGSGPYAWQLFPYDEDFPYPDGGIDDVVAYNGGFVFSNRGRISSWDPSTGWKYSDGTGTGTGPYNDASALGNTANTISSYGKLAVWSTMLIATLGYGRLASFDGTNWKNYDGTGTGTGPYGDILHGSGYPIMAIATYSDGDYLIIGSGGIRVSSYDGTNWKKYDGTGSGTGPYINSGTLLGVADIADLKEFGEYLVVTGKSISYGRVASWDGTNWKNYDGSGSGTGLYDNGTYVAPGYYGNGPLMQIFDGALLFLSDYNKISSWDGTNWKKYDGTGTGTGLYGNSIKEMGFAPNICPSRSINIFDNKLVVTSAGRIGYYDFDEAAWVKYNESTNLTNCTSYIGTVQMTYIYNGCLLFTQSGGLISSFDGTNWKKYDGTGTGTGLYCDLSTHGITSIRAICEYDGCLVIGGNTGRICSYDGANWKYYDGTGSGTGIYADGTGWGNKEVGLDFATYSGCLIVPIIGTLDAQAGSNRAGYSGMVVSYDGTNWKYWDGSGSGTGPYHRDLDFQPYGAIAYDGDLLIYGNRNGSVNLAIASFDGTNWKNHDGTGSGTGLYYGGTIARSVQEVIVADSNLIFANASMTSSYDGSNWKHWDGTGTGTGPWSDGQPTLYESSSNGVYSNGMLYVAGVYEAIATCKISNNKWCTANGLWIDSISSDDMSDYIAVNAALDSGFVRVDMKTSRNYSTILSNVAFPTSGPFETSLSWDIDNCPYVNSSGFVTRPEEQGVMGTFTATVTRNSATAVGYTSLILLGYAPTSYRDSLRLNGGNKMTASTGAGPTYVVGYYKNKVVFGSSNSEISSFESTWTAYNAGSGLRDNGSYVTNGVKCLTAYDNFSGSYMMAICGDGISSWDGTNWKKYDGTGTGTGPYWSFNGGTNPQGGVYSDTYIIVADGCHISSYDGTNWKKYDGTGTGTGPYDNGNVVDSAGTTVKPRIYRDKIIFAAGSDIGSWDGSNFKNHDGTGTGTGPYNDNIGFVITAICIDWNGNLVVGGEDGKIASWDGSNWKYSDGSGSGTGPYNSGTIVGGMDIHSMILINGRITVLATSSGVCRFGNISSSGTRNYDGTGSGIAYYSGTDSFFLGSNSTLTAVGGAGNAGPIGASNSGIYMIGDYERIGNFNVGGMYGYAYDGTGWND